MSLKTIEKIENVNKLINQIKNDIINDNKKLNEDKCPICLCDNTNNNKIILSCNHILHADCYTQMVINNVNNYTDIKCPICRNMVEKIELELNNDRELIHSHSDNESDSDSDSDSDSESESEDNNINYELRRLVDTQLINSIITLLNR